MDVVPDKALYDFIDSIGGGGGGGDDVILQDEASTLNINNNNNKSPSLATVSTIDDGDDGDDNDIWEGITDALDNWMERVLDAEARHSKTIDFTQRIEQSLTRQQQDGFLTYDELAKLRYITDLWQRLLHASSCYTIGCDFLKRDIITLLLDLHTIQQISASAFITTCSKL